MISIDPSLFIHHHRSFYNLPCKRCNQFEKRLADHFVEQISTIRMRDFSFPVARHFNSHEHRIMSNELRELEEKPRLHSQNFGNLWNECHILTTANKSF